MNVTQVRCHGCDRVFSPRGLSQHLSKNDVCRATQAALKTPSVFQTASCAGQTSNSVPGDCDTADPADATDADVLEALSNNPSTAPNLERDRRIEVQTSVPLEFIEPEPECAPPTYSTSPEADSLDEASQLFICNFPHGSPGAPIPGACQGSSFYHSNQETFCDSNWAPFYSQCDWEIAHWAKMRAPTSLAMEELLAIPEVCVHI